jgi:hypothetical protein
VRAIVQTGGIVLGGAAEGVYGPAEEIDEPIFWTPLVLAEKLSPWQANEKALEDAAKAEANNARTWARRRGVINRIKVRRRRIPPL